MYTVLWVLKFVRMRVCTYECCWFCVRVGMTIFLHLIIRTEWRDKVSGHLWTHVFLTHHCVALLHTYDVARIVPIFALVSYCFAVVALHCSWNTSCCQLCGCVGTITFSSYYWLRPQGWYSSLQIAVWMIGVSWWWTTLTLEIWFTLKITLTLTFVLLRDAPLHIE